MRPLHFLRCVREIRAGFLQIEGYVRVNDARGRRPRGQHAAEPYRPGACWSLGKGGFRREDSMRADRLTAPQRESLRQALQTKRAQLEQSLARLTEEAIEGGADSPELEDVAEGVIEDHDREALQEHDRRLLAEVLHALHKFEAGTYGLSEASGEPISLKRLRAVPWARLAVDEAERLERPGTTK
jgi:RNA polymerase-binding transcription factor